MLMAFNIALVTNEDLHHKFWVCELYKRLNVVLIIHPRAPFSLKGLYARIKRKRITQNGYPAMLWKILSLFFNRVFKKSRDRIFKKVSFKYFSNYQELYEAIPKVIIFKTATVNSPETINKIKEKKIDFLLFLGGDIAKKELIESPRYKTLNFHSGVSPFYNGNKTNFHAFKNSDFDCIGGTLMYMSQKIDRGHILMHTFPSIESKDNASSLFLKNIQLSVQACQSFLEYFSKTNNLPTGVYQTNTKYYFKNIDWNIVDDFKLINVESNFVKSKTSRKNQLINYFDLNREDINMLLERVFATSAERKKT